jgi:hypothetical protein
VFWEPLVLAIGLAESWRVAVGWATPTGTGFNSVKDDYELGNLFFDPLGLKPTDAEELKVRRGSGRAQRGRGRAACSQGHWRACRPSAAARRSPAPPPAPHRLLVLTRAPTPYPPPPKVMETKELNNGRLAMIAIAAFTAQELVNGREIFEHLFVDIEKEIVAEEGTVVKEVAGL